MLLALASAQIVQTLHSIKVHNILFGVNLAVIPIFELVKQSNHKNRNMSLNLKGYAKKPALCVVKVLKEYIQRTKDLRGNENQLFISFQRPHAAVSRSTISRWLKRVMEEAGLDIEVFSGHSTRAASCAKLKSDGVDIDEILRTAGWSSDKTFKKFYDKSILVEQE